MNKDFVLYPQAVALRDLGFNEPCLGFYDGKGDTTLYFNNLRDASGDFELFSNNKRLTWFGAPTYSQAFRWFRDVHKLHAEIKWDPSYEYDPGQWSDAIYEITIVDVSFTKEWVAYSLDFQRADGKQLTYEGAESACLDRLIEIVKNEEIKNS